VGATAYGIDVCQGLADKKGHGYLQYVAVSFHKDVRVLLSVIPTKEQLVNVKVKDVPLKARQIADGTTIDRAAEIYRDFVEILNRLRFP
jgi:hypothetical protein